MAVVPADCEAHSTRSMSYVRVCVCEMSLKCVCVCIFFDIHGFIGTLMGACIIHVLYVEYV